MVGQVLYGVMVLVEQVGLVGQGFFLGDYVYCLLGVVVCGVGLYLGDFGVDFVDFGEVMCDVMCEGFGIYFGFYGYVIGD